MSKTSRRRHAARERHKIGKRRAQYRRILKGLRDPGVWHYTTFGDPSDHTLPPEESFDSAVEKILALGTKTLQQLLSDIDSGVKVFWDKKMREDLKYHVQLAIMERTILK